jgi:hypothetical protein
MSGEYPALVRQGTNVSWLSIPPTSAMAESLISQDYDLSTLPSAYGMSSPLSRFRFQ